MHTELPAFTLGSACAALINARLAHSPKAVFVSTMSAMFALDVLGETTRRIDSVPLMGGAGGLGLGIALAQPAVPVIVLDGDASLLMELGTLATVAHNHPHQYLHVVVNNGVQFNGATNFPVAGTEPQVDFAAMAKGAGYTRARRIDNHADWCAALPELLAAQGSTLIDLEVQPDRRVFGAERPQPILADLQFMRMRLGARKLKAELAT
ncbi:thiamine pyrophosphate-dependent enzyme [Acidovorax sp.]|uniref:thiamine pyrophosphate-dependent enzyme n=1 Tax=Acidovorax sp. TaxID=1872122 RepID=UPI00260BDFE2|nr:thiamine pyrophosphate-dependent enzyme [Acidovorax sp.]